MSHSPLFSIITVTYNAGKTILRTLESVDSQDCKSYEHIIIDGASKDDTLKIINDCPNPRRKVFSEPDRGIYDGMNKGLGRAQGKYVIFLNAGDKFHSSDILSKYEKAHDEYGVPGIIYGQTNLVDDKGRFLAPRHLTAPVNLTYRDFSHGMLVCHQAMCVLRKIASYYELKYRYSADYEWCIRCLQHSRSNIYIPGVVIDYLAEGVTTANRRASLIERFKIMSYYYGFFPTLGRHFGFLSRFVKFNRRMKKAVEQTGGDSPRS